MRDAMRLDQDTRSTLNTALWTLQVLWGVFFSLNGFGKIACYEPALWQQALHQVPWLSALSPHQFIFIGVCEFLGGIGLILPAMTGIKSQLTPFAALGLTLVMIFAAVFHVARGEYAFVSINLLLGGVSAFIAYGRLHARPVAPISFSAVRAVQAFAVLGVLIVVDVAPVWYKLSQLGH
jgi:uncharacterized membrane protein YphA (DoxX/SURF4 family)